MRDLKGMTPNPLYSTKPYHQCCGTGAGTGTAGTV
jgi:hypothetical protein